MPPRRSYSRHACIRSLLGWMDAIVERDPRCSGEWDISLGGSAGVSDTESDEAGGARGDGDGGVGDDERAARGGEEGEWRL